MTMLTCIKQQLSNIWSSIQKKIMQHRGWLEKTVTYIKKRIIWNVQHKKSNSFYWMHVICQVFQNLEFLLVAVSI